jgi:hypothetical protein
VTTVRSTSLTSWAWVLSWPTISFTGRSFRRPSLQTNQKTQSSHCHLLMAILGRFHPGPMLFRYLEACKTLRQMLLRMRNCIQLRTLTRTGNTMPYTGARDAAT